MKIWIRNGLPIVELTLHHNGKSMILNNVLLDTGCATSIFDTDLVEEIDLVIDPHLGRAMRMFGVGGQSEVCFQQPVSGLKVDDYKLDHFLIQLGMTKLPYGFDGIIGIDFLLQHKLIIDFDKMEIRAI